MVKFLLHVPFVSLLTSRRVLPSGKGLFREGANHSQTSCSASGCGTEQDVTALLGVASQTGRIRAKMYLDEPCRLCTGRLFSFGESGAGAFRLLRRGSLFRCGCEGRGQQRKKI